MRLPPRIAILSLSLTSFAAADVDRAAMFTTSQVDIDAPATASGPIACADLDGDGDRDLVSASIAGFVMFNNGEGADPTTLTFPLLDNALWEVALDDLDGNGLLDVVVDHPGGVGVYLATGPGVFGPGAFHATTDWPYGVTTADLDGDGDVDIVASVWDGTVAILENAGNGLFFPAQPIVPGEAAGPCDVFGVCGLVAAITVDVNLDGAPDIVVPHAGADELAVLLNDGSGSFDLGAPVPMGALPSEVVSADFNGDRIPDLVASLRFGTTDAVKSFVGNGDGTFTPGPSYTIYQPYRMSVWDGNGDAHPDVVLATESGIVWSMLGAGDGSFVFEGPYSTGKPWSEICVGDVNGDGHDDLALSKVSTIGIVPGRGDGTFDLDPGYDAREANGVALADFNGDGRLDMAATSIGWLQDDNQAGVSVLLSDGDASFTLPAFHPVAPAAASSSVLVIEARDLDDDGAQDIVLIDKNSATAFVLLGAGDGDFAAPVGYATGSSPATIAAGDLDADGVLDLVVGLSSAEHVDILRGNGDGTFQPREPLLLGTLAVAVVDLNGDGHLDLAALDLEDGFHSRLGNGDGSFEPRVHHTGALLPRGLVAGDFDGDGVPDIAVTSSFNSPLPTSVHFGTGDGSFGTATSLDFGGNTQWGPLLAGDLDDDGRDDLVLWVAMIEPYGLAVLFGNADHTFDKHFYQSFNLSGAIGDVDGDGALDLAASNNTGGHHVPKVVEVRLNKGFATSACPADVDGSGNVDVSDLLAVILAWGTCEDCPQDVDGDGIVGVGDLVAIITAWGTCG